MTKLEEHLIRLLEELALHESVICLPCAYRQILRDAETYLLQGEHRTAVCSSCATREVGYGNAEGLMPVEQPYITTRIREELRLLPLVSPEAREPAATKSPAEEQR